MERSEEQSNVKIKVWSDVKKAPTRGFFYMRYTLVYEKDIITIQILHKRFLFVLIHRQR